MYDKFKIMSLVIIISLLTDFISFDVGVCSGVVSNNMIVGGAKHEILLETEIIEAQNEYYVDIVDGRITTDSLKSICRYIGNMYNIQPELLQSIAWVESSYIVNAVSKHNAKGLCQVMEKWHKDRIIKLNITDIFDPYSSVLLCADILSDIRGGKYGHDVRFMIMAYNMGVAGATKPYEVGNISDYTIKVMNKFQELKKKEVEQYD